MNEGNEFRSEEEQREAESFTVHETPQTVPEERETERELNDRLLEKATESFWLEKHGLLEPPLVNRLRESSTAFLKKGGQRLLTALGAAAALAGAAYLEKDDIIDSIDSVMKSPVVTETLEESWNQPFVIDAKGQVTDSEVSTTFGRSPSDKVRLHELDDSVSQTLAMEKERNKIMAKPYATIKLKGTTIELREEMTLFDDQGQIKDHGAKIELTDPYLQNLTNGPHPFLQPATNPHRFSEFIKQEAGELFNTYKDNQDGDVGQFLKVADTIVNQNLNYDEQTAAWLTPGQGGQTNLKWGGNNPFTAFLSSDQTPVDELLMDKKVGVCRHYAEALPLVCEELKRQNPDKFQNIYVTPLADAYQMHEYNTIYVVTGPHEAKMFVYDPTAGMSKGSPAFDLFRTLYHRQVIDKSLFVKLSGEYIQDASSSLGWGDMSEYSAWALGDGSPEAIKAMKPGLEYFISEVTKAYHNQETDKGRQRVWGEFENKVWPIVHQYQELTGEQIYPIASEGIPEADKES